ncbi:MAG: FHA domain-containing protein [Armatimonadetes bacterium]|nr:FHA domain-containing protein [Armatimonadota bacterium]
MTDEPAVIDTEAADEAVHEEPQAEAPEQEAPAGNARIVVKRGGVETDDVFPVNPPAIIGRFDPSVGPIDVDLASIPESSYVSRKHAKITNEDGAWMIHDMGSSNGTFVLQDGDFARVEMAELTDGTEFALGNARFLFRVD